MMATFLMDDDSEAVAIGTVGWQPEERDVGIAGGHYVETLLEVRVDVVADDRRRVEVLVDIGRLSRTERARAEQALVDVADAERANAAADAHADGHSRASVARAFGKPTP